MRPYDKNATSPSKRLVVSLNVDTGKRTENSPPQTPVAQSSRASRSNKSLPNRALKGRNGQRETFLDDITPVDGSSNKENVQGRDYQDTHGLSLSPRQITRDSLVDHMLLSLDQFSFGQDDPSSSRQPTVDEERLYATFADEDTYQPTRNFAARNPRAPGHNYSYSSEYDNRDDSSQYSGHLSRGRRSNSSSNFQFGLGRINSVRNEVSSNPQGYSRSRAGSNTNPVQIPYRGLHSRSRKGSKGSSANSLDLGYTQITNSQRWGHGLHGRSSSFDFGSDRQSMSMQIARPMNTNTVAFNSYDYDAAPTPTVPVGPRRPRPASPIVIPQQEIPLSDPTPQKPERKRSTRSSKSAYKGRNPVNVSTGGRLDYGLHDRSRELPPLPASMKESAPAPLVGYGKSKDTPPAAATQPKEKQGFFRRVFGSSRNQHTNAPDLPRSHGSTTSAETGDRPNSKPHHIGNQIKPQNTPPPREPPLPPAPKEHGHVLTKKSSSFFRRRKKSVSEVDSSIPVPLMPSIKLQIENDESAGTAEPSPVSSLRQVMNPYIRTPQRSPTDLYLHDSIDQNVNDTPESILRTTRGFSPDYEPAKSATIRAVDPPSREAVDSLPSSYSSAQRPYLTAVVAGNESHPQDDNNHSFLQDSSDNDRSTSSKTARPLVDVSDTTWLGTLTPNSPSVARDMALVAEYERAHSKRSPTSAKFDLVKSSPTTSTNRSPTESKMSVKKTIVNGKEEEWVMLTPSKPPAQIENESRVWLEPSSSDDDLPSTNLEPPFKKTSERTSGSTETVYQSATSLPIVHIEGEEHQDSESQKSKVMTRAEATKALDELVQESTPREEDRETAKRIYDGDEDFIQKEKAAAWMGDEGAARVRTLVAYMELYDFVNLNILAALRVLCGRLVLKGETQQVDRILDRFAQRWCQCNPDHGFKVTNVVYTICYSLLLLNTDLHLADIDQKMSRSQFVKNTMPTVKHSVIKSAPDSFESNRPTVLPGKSQTFDSVKSENSLKAERQSAEVERPSWRSSFKPPSRQDSGGVASTPLDYDTPMDDCGPLVKAPFHGTLRTWEVQIEIVLKDFYNSIRNERLPLSGAALDKAQVQTSSNTLSVFTNGMLRRSPSVLSRTPSESQTYVRGRTAESARTGNTKWGAKNRSRPRLYPNSGLGSSRTSLDDQSSMWSPSVSSSTWSKYSLGKTHTSLSVGSLGSSYPQGDYQQSIGFANALSQAIIREEHIGSAGSGSNDHEELRVAPLLEDESLELAGAPWAKEGIVKHKHHLEALDKKAKDRNWNEVFAVIEKGYMSLFSFSTKSMRNKSRGKSSGGVVGGGNWQENAESLGSFLLRQTIASALPSPGYSKARPHVWALSLPTGAVHLFQVGTPDIVKEFVSTANYWSARLSNHPLVGGISNIEYGWSENIVNNALVNAINESSNSGRVSSSGHRPSLQSSLRSSLDQGTSTGIRARLPGDKIMISDWTPPTQSMRASNLMEPDQLTTLMAYVSGIEEELQKHNQLRSPMLLAFTPRHPNAIKAMANWEKKSSYLLREIVKFRTYIDCLQAAEQGKQKIYAERAAHKASLTAANADGSDEEGDLTLQPE